MIDIKEKINECTKRSCLPGSREVFVRHESEPVELLPGESPWANICFLIHPDVTVKEFFA